MSLSVWPHAILFPRIDGYSFVETRDVLTVAFGRGTYEQRADRAGRRFRTYDVEYYCTEADRQRVVDFLAARSNRYESFLWRDPLDNVRRGASLGTSVAAQTVFNLPTTGEAGGDYPVSNTLAVLKDDGAIITSTVQTDDRTMTASVAPTASSVMTADYEYCKRVRLDVEPRWRLIGDGALFSVALTLKEVPS